MFEDLIHETKLNGCSYLLRTGNVEYKGTMRYHIVTAIIPYIAASRIYCGSSGVLDYICVDYPTKKQLALYKLKYTPIPEIAVIYANIPVILSTLDLEGKCKYILNTTGNNNV